MVTMESDSYRHVLRMEDDDVHTFQRVNDGWEITFKRATLTVNYMHVAEVVRDYTRNTDLEDKSKYWKTEDLIAQLEAWKKQMERNRDNYKRLNSISAAMQAHRFQIEISLLDTILDDLRDGDNIWDAEED